MKFHSLNCNFDNLTEVENSNLLNVKLKILHDGDNKKSRIGLDAIKKAEKTIYNIPILGHILDDGSDFDQHNMALKKTDDNKYVLHYIEKPLGVIPADTEITYEEIDGRTYFCATGLVWKKYANEGYDIIVNSNTKGVSMEIEINEGELDEDNVYNIKDFTFLGVTVLGDNVEPGMYDTELEKYTASKIYKEELYEIYKEFYACNNEKEEDILENEIKVEETEDKKVSTVTGEFSESTVTVEADGVTIEVNEKEDNVEVFSLSIDDMHKAINNKIKDMKVEIVDEYWNEKYMTREFYLRTIIPDDKIAVLEDNVNYGNYYGVSYKIKGDDVELNLDNKVSYMQEWRAKQEGDVMLPMEKFDDKKDMIIAKFDKQKIELDEVKEELTKLEEFKAEKNKEELKVSVEEVVKEFSNLQDEEVESFKLNALEGKITLDELKKELFCLVGMKSLNSKQVFSNDKKDEEIALIPNTDTYSQDQVEVKEYGGLFAKHGIK